MYFFTRTARIGGGHMVDATNWAVELTGRVNQVADLRLQLWSSILSPATGTLAWSTFVPDLTTLDTANSKLTIDPGFLQETEKGAQFMIEGSLDDLVLQLVHTAGEPADDPHFAAIVASGMAAGGYAKGVEVGMEIARRGAELSGLATSFLVATTGPYGGCAWMTAASTLDELDRGGQAINSDPDFIGFLDAEAAGVFRPEVSTQTMWRRLA